MHVTDIFQAKINSVPPEDRKIADFFPDLPVTGELKIEKLEEGNNDLVHQFYMEQPIPPFKRIQNVLEPKFEIMDINVRKVKKQKQLLKYIEPTELELSNRIEYDMDLIDKEFLKISRLQISELQFEEIIDQLEKEWFHLVKDNPKVQQQQQQDRCAVCDDAEAENSNAIVFCDGCDLAVHQDCYGIPFIPEGQWLCRRCMVEPDKPISCVVCPVTDGAFKQTNRNKWAHLVCGIWIPECSIQNSIFMEPIEGIENIPKTRWKLLCYLCQKRYGAPIQCSTKNCFTAFHPTCALKAKLYMKMRSQDNLKAYCDKHSPREYREQIDLQSSLSQAIIELRNNSNDPMESASPLKRVACEKTRIVSMTAPIIPQYILDKVTNKTEISAATIVSIAKYWALKKESTRGAALLKRLHIEPWTASISISKEEEEMKALNYETLSAVRRDLEQVKLILELVQKREKQKLSIHKYFSNVFEHIVYPLDKIFNIALMKIKSFDKNEFFYEPVDIKIVVDYLNYISFPMDFRTMEQKIKNREYQNLDDFQSDIELICTNCLLYNRSDTVYAKEAIKLQTNSRLYLEFLKSFLEEAQYPSVNRMASIPEQVLHSSFWNI